MKLPKSGRIFIGKPSKDEINVDYVPSVFWRGKTKSPTGTHVSILSHERCVCVVRHWVKRVMEALSMVKFIWIMLMV